MFFSAIFYAIAITCWCLGKWLLG